ncbi:MAG TPA: hypothetical protein VMQ10_00285 [Spirochaetia bacterium]|nr:hypothetical protein [Spirochaetia bacterium]
MNVRPWIIAAGVIALAIQAFPLQAQALKQTVVVPDGTTVPPVKTGDDQPAVTLEPAEQVAFLFVYGIWNLENRLLDKDMGGTGKLASLRELVKGVKTEGGVQGLAVDPAKDINYGYDLVLVGRDVLIRAIPRKPGLSAFAMVGSPERMMGNFYYVAASADFARGVRLTEMGYSGSGFVK